MAIDRARENTRDAKNEKRAGDKPPLTHDSRNRQASARFDDALLAQVLEFGAHLGCRSKAFFGFLLERFSDDAVKLRRDLWVYRRRRGRRSVQDGIGDGSGSLTFKWPASGSHLIENGSEAEQITA